MSKEYKLAYLDNFQYADSKYLVAQLKERFISSKEEGITLLEKALKEIRLDCVELFLLNGANPTGISGFSWDQTSAEAFIRSKVPPLSSETFTSQFISRVIPWNCESTGYVNSRHQKRQKVEFIIRELASIFDLHRLPQHFRPKFALTWLESRNSPPRFIPDVEDRSDPHIVAPLNFLPTCNFGPLEYNEKYLIAWIHVFNTIVSMLLTISNSYLFFV